MYIKFLKTVSASKTAIHCDSTSSLVKQTWISLKKLRKMDGKCKKKVFEMSKKQKKWFFDIWLKKEVISNCLLSLNGKGKMVNP